MCIFVHFLFVRSLFAVLFLCWHFVALFDDFPEFTRSSCDSDRLLFMCAFLCILCNFPPLRPLARIVSINCLLPDALYPDHTVFHGFPTASGPDKKITGPGSTVHRVRPCIPPPQKRSRGIIRDSFPYLSICFNCPSASPSIQNPSAFPLIRTSSIATARRWYA